MLMIKETVYLKKALAWFAAGHESALTIVMATLVTITVSTKAQRKTRLLENEGRNHNSKAGANTQKVVLTYPLPKSCHVS